ncbi:MAG: DUF4159 domain-containing protein [Alphaproteobacteria bacterium]|nr:DUF4159 domain-containing protein [Alphaproteobacteria bacterium]MBU6472496.1 DUF4159 domain-containing protein [Alphaproteobacteria bacterium]MDE2013740.1 DUF4159 domain-containing protein [Alphaproteobacteria bacterium]
MSFLAALNFASPWLLVALAALPAIWWLLRVTPPAPRRQLFPPLRLLLGLNVPEETPARTPPWLLALRLIAAALIVFALSGPSIGTPPKPLGKGPLVLFIDNDWSAAHAWKDREAAISDALSGAARADRAVMLVPTASGQAPKITQLDAGAAQRQAREMGPQPWEPNRTRAVAALQKVTFALPPEVLWFSDGLDHGDAGKTAEALAKLGTLTVFSDAPGKGPLALKPQSGAADGFKLRIVRAGTGGARSGHVEALGGHGEVLASAPFAFKPGDNAASATIKVPLEVHNETRQLVIANENSAGAVRLLDSSSQRRKIGIVAAGNLQSEQPLLSGSYYLARALAPYADLTNGTIGEVLARKVAVLMLSDIGKIAGEDHDLVERFVEDGGVLVRFAGGRMAEGTDDLVPVKLRVGGRYLGGSLAWAKPQHLAPFPASSPFRGLTIPGDVTVSRQVLAEPSVELAERSWARLSDGTPLVTAQQRGRGWIVLFHVTAGPTWSSLPLSGLFIDMLKRLIDLSGGARPGEMASDAHASFPPQMALDGFGHLQKPAAEALPIRGDQFGKVALSPLHPPGLYGSKGAEVALNVVKADTVLMPLPGLNAPLRAYTGTKAVSLTPYLLASAIVLLMADALIALWLRGLIALPRGLLARLGISAVVLLLVVPQARADDAFAMKAALNTRLAYVITGIPDVDAMSKAGLTGLGLWLKARTSYEPEAPMGVDLAKDDLAFFPLIYWPMDPREKNLSPAALSKIADYMRGGGTFLIDTRDLTLGPTRGPDNPGEQTLRRLLAKVDLPALEPVPSDHVLTKAFYLLQTFPGRWAGGKVWVEALPPADLDRGPEPARGGDGVSPVIIGSDDYAAAWAVDAQGQPLAACVPGGDRQRELAIRFGINVVMYALTGNYKTDQIHVPALLERLGK